MYNFSIIKDKIMENVMIRVEALTRDKIKSLASREHRSMLQTVDKAISFFIDNDIRLDDKGATSLAIIKNKIDEGNREILKEMKRQSKQYFRPIEEQVKEIKTKVITLFPENHQEKHRQSEEEKIHEERQAEIDGYLNEDENEFTPQAKSAPVDDVNSSVKSELKKIILNSVLDEALFDKEFDTLSKVHVYKRSFTEAELGDLRSRISELLK